MRPHLPPAPSQTPRRRRRGTAALSDQAFTLVEMIIVVLIVGIAAALALPMFGQTDLTRLRSAAGLLAADLGYAQIESIAHGDDLRIVVFDQDANSYRIATAADPDTPITNPIGNLPYTTTFGAGRARDLAGVTIQGYDLAGDDRIQFGIYGQLDQATVATITLAAGGASVTISIDPTSGEVSVGPIQ